MNNNQQKLVKALNRRLKESSKFWYQAIDDYQDIEEFLSSINALIQALRNITFILQSNKQLIPNFDIWYEEEQAEMRRDKLLKWLHDRRNEVVKQKDLELKSLAKVSVFNWRDFQLFEWEIKPFMSTQDIVVSMPEVMRDFFFKKLREPVLKLERKWAVETLPDMEILEALATCYEKIKQIVLRSYEAAGIDLKDVNMDGVEKDQHILLKRTPDKNRVLHFDLKDGKILKRLKEKLDITAEIEKESKTRYGSLPAFSSSRTLSPDPFNMINDFIASAKQILKIDGKHASMVFYFFKDGISSSIILFENKSQQYLLMREIAKDIREKGIQGLLFIQEGWGLELEKFSGVYPADHPQKKEFFDITAIRQDGKFESHITPFLRIGENIVFEETFVSKDLSNAYWLHPILESWNISI